MNRIGLLLALASAVGARQAQPPDLAVAGTLPLELEGTSPALKAVVTEAWRAEQAGQWEKAAAGWRLALLRDPALVPAVLGLGRALAALGDTAGADAAWAALPNEPDVVRARAVLLEERDPATALALWRRLQTLDLGSAEPYRREACLLAATDPVGAEHALERYLDLLDGEPDGDSVLRVASGLKDAGDRDAAARLVARVLERWPALEGGARLQTLADRISVENEASRLALGGGEPLGSGLRQGMEEARGLAASGHLDEATERLRDLVARAPRSAEAWASLGEVQIAAGRVAEAERSLAAAVLLAPEEPTWHADLGLLLADRYGGRRNDEAIRELRTALGLRPGWTAIQCRLARILQHSGEPAAAREAWRACLDGAPAPSDAEEARQALADLERRSPAPVILPDSRPGAELPEEARWHYRVARVYRQRGDAGAARAEAEEALALAPAYTDALLLLAALDVEAGRPQDALARYRRCLAEDPDDPRILLAAGELERALGHPEEADALLRRGAEAGASEAWYLLAAVAAEEGRPREARALLDAFFARSPGGLAREPALALAERVDRALWGRRVAFAAGLALLLVGPLAWWLRRRTGATLVDLIERIPDAYHDVAGILAGIRHEVLKHRTTVLPSIAERLERGDLTAASWAVGALFGEAEEPGVQQRFDTYLADLEAVGRRHRVRLALRHRDPVIGPMHRAMTRLGALRGALERPDPARVQGLARTLREVSRVLNEDGYAALGRLLRRVSVLEVDADLLQAVGRRVAAEPGLVDAPAVEVEGGEEAVPVRVFPRDFEEIAANLIRNAIGAVVEECPPEARRVGVAMGLEVDPVTGHEVLALRFRDSAPSPLADAILSGRGIDRGLGLAADRIARNRGVVHVEPEPGWAKAVVVRFPRAEEEAS
ncbi:MAG: tetratricopeptide repeat protein [Deltaproteobacteria bacterium]|nr:tetratricopeptide repeat protein [Deltaproteobacteria bacterium]